MKFSNILKTLFFVILFSFFAQNVFADQNIVLNPVPTSEIDRCLALPKNLKPLKIVGTTHAAADESVGVIRTKNTSERFFVAGGATMVVQDSVRNTLTRCGYKFSDSAEALRLSIVIKDFFTKTANEGLVGKDTASMTVTLRLEVPDDNHKYEVDFAMEQSSKTSFFGKNKRFVKTLTSVMTDVMNQIAMSETLMKMVQVASTLPTGAAVIEEDTTRKQNGD